LKGQLALSGQSDALLRCASTVECVSKAKTPILAPARQTSEATAATSVHFSSHLSLQNSKIENQKMKNIIFLSQTHLHISCIPSFSHYVSWLPQRSSLKPWSNKQFF
jgi:hypothetical protein